MKAYPIIRSDISQGSAFTFLLYDLPAGDLESHGLALEDLACVMRVTSRAKRERISAPLPD